MQTLWPCLLHSLVKMPHCWLHALHCALASELQLNDSKQCTAVNRAQLKTLQSLEHKPPDSKLDWRLAADNADGQQQQQMRCMLLCCCRAILACVGPQQLLTWSICMFVAVSCCSDWMVAPALPISLPTRCLDTAISSDMVPSSLAVVPRPSLTGGGPEVIVAITTCSKESAGLGEQLAKGCTAVQKDL
jgi:hypothetical protein